VVNYTFRPLYHPVKRHDTDYSTVVGLRAVWKVTGNFASTGIRTPKPLTSTE